MFILGARASSPWQFQASYGTQGDLFVCPARWLLCSHCRLCGQAGSSRDRKSILSVVNGLPPAALKRGTEEAPRRLRAPFSYWPLMSNIFLRYSVYYLHYCYEFYTCLVPISYANLKDAVVEEDDSANETPTDSTD